MREPVSSRGMSTVEQARLGAEPSESRLEFETLISDLSSRFVDLPPAEVDREIEGAWAAFAVSSVSTIPCSGNGRLRPRESSLPPTSTGPRRVRNLPRPLHQEHFPWVVGQMRAGRRVAISSLEGLPAEAAVDRESAPPQWHQVEPHPSAVRRAAAAVGALAFNALREERDWPAALVGRLQLVAQLFTNALERADEAVGERGGASHQRGAPGGGRRPRRPRVLRSRFRPARRLRRRSIPRSVRLPPIGKAACGPWSSGWSTCTPTTGRA